MNGSEQPSADLLIAELDEVLRTAPPRATFRHNDMANLAWRGRAAAVIAQWNILQSVPFDQHIAALQDGQANVSERGYAGIFTMLHRARADLSIRTANPVNVVIDKGQVFDYFDKIRKIIERARKDVLFVDQYLDAEFVSRYLPMIHPDAAVRLLTSAKSAQKLAPAVATFCAQAPLKVSVKTSPEPHDRWIFIDGVECYQSGASFKDGARLSPSSITQISDAQGLISRVYEDIWSRATVAL